MYSVLVILHFEKGQITGVCREGHDRTTSRRWELLAKWIKIAWNRVEAKEQATDREELQALAESIKQVYYQDYKTAYGEDDEKVKASDFGYII